MKLNRDGNPEPAAVQVTPPGGRLVVPDGCPLTPQEYRCLQLHAEGLATKQVALKMGLQPSTVRTQMSCAYQRLGVWNCVTAVLRCVREGWIEL